MKPLLSDETLASMRERPRPYWVNVYEQGPGPFAWGSRESADTKRHLERRLLYRVKIVPRPRAAEDDTPVKAHSDVWFVKDFRR